MIIEHAVGANLPAFEAGNLLLDAKEYAIKCHQDTNHMYDGDISYTLHLNYTAAVGRMYMYLIPERHRQAVFDALWCHDVIEDTRQTYSDVKKVIGTLGADIVYAVTNEKGRNRAERANDKYYDGIRRQPYAVFVKCCDRIANIIYSFAKNKDKLEMYRAEHKRFKEQLYTELYAPLFEKMDDALLMK